MEAVIISGENSEVLLKGFPITGTGGVQEISKKEERARILDCRESSVRVNGVDVPNKE